MKLFLCHLSQALHHKVNLTGGGIASYRLSLSTSPLTVLPRWKKPSVPTGKMLCLYTASPDPVWYREYSFSYCYRSKCATRAQIYYTYLWNRTLFSCYVIEPINFSLRWNRTMKSKGRFLHLHSMKKCKVTAGSSPFIRLVTRLGRVVDSPSGRFSPGGKNPLQQMKRTFVSPRGDVDVLDHKNIVHLPGLDHRIYHLVAYSTTDTIIFLLNHISGPVHCMTAAGL